MDIILHDFVGLNHPFLKLKKSFGLHRAWFNCVNIAKDNPVERKTLLEAFSVSEADKDIIRREVKLFKSTCF